MPASEKQPGTNRVGPDPAAGYGREKPELEAGMGRLDNNDDAVPADKPDQEETAVANRHLNRQINADDEFDSRDCKREADCPLTPPQGQPDHSMLDEEAAGEDLAPEDIHDPRMKRHPRREGKGGTP